MTVLVLAFWRHAFVQTIGANFIADVIAAVIIYLILERTLKFGDAKRHRDESNRKILDFISQELGRNLERTDRMIARLERRTLSYPGLGEAGWSLIVQEQVFASVKPDLLAALLHAYDQVRAANDVYRNLLATVQNPELLTFSSPDEEERFAEHLQSMRDNLIERLSRLRAPMSHAVEVLQSELGTSR